MAAQIENAQANIPLYYATVLPSVPPAAPSTGWVLYTDTNDSNKLKAIASTGTIVLLGTP